MAHAEPIVVRLRFILYPVEGRASSGFSPVDRCFRQILPLVIRAARNQIHLPGRGGGTDRGMAQPYHLLGILGSKLVASQHCWSRHMKEKTDDTLKEPPLVLAEGELGHPFSGSISKDWPPSQGKGMRLCLCGEEHVRSEMLPWPFMEKSACHRAQSPHEQRAGWESGGPELRSPLPCSGAVWRGSQWTLQCCILICKMANHF